MNISFVRFCINASAWEKLACLILLYSSMQNSRGHQKLTAMCKFKYIYLRSHKYAKTLVKGKRCISKVGLAYDTTNSMLSFFTKTIYFKLLPLSNHKKSIWTITWVRFAVVERQRTWHRSIVWWVFLSRFWEVALVVVVWYKGSLTTGRAWESPAGNRRQS